MNNRFVLLAVAALVTFSCSGAGGGSPHPKAGPLLAQIAQRVSPELIQEVRAAEEAGEMVGQIHSVQVRDDDPSWGLADAPVTLVVFSDFQCPFCGRAADTIRELKGRYGDLLRVVFKQFPLPFHNQAMPRAQASLAANAQGKFWPMHDKLFAREGLEDPQLKVWAEQQGIDWDRLVAAVEANEYEARVREDMKDGEALGVRGTPCSFVNGIQVSGAVPIDAMATAVDIGLARAYLALQKGADPADLARILTSPPKQK